MDVPRLNEASGRKGGYYMDESAEHLPNPGLLIEVIPVLAVPTSSSTDLLNTRMHPASELSSENADSLRQILVSGVEHAAMCNDQQVTAALDKILAHMLGGA